MAEEARRRPSQVGTRNPLDRDFNASALNAKWVTDLAYIRTAEHWVVPVVLWTSVRARTPVGGARRADDVMAAPRLHSGHSALGSELSIYLGGISTLPGGASGDVQYECGVQLRGQGGGRELLRILKHERVNRRHYRTRAEARAHIFDYIERAKGATTHLA